MIQRRRYYCGSGLTEREKLRQSPFMSLLGHTAGLAFRLCVQYFGLQLWGAPFSRFPTSDPSTSEGTKLGEEVGGANGSTVTFSTTLRAYGNV